MAKNKKRTEFKEPMWLAHHGDPEPRRDPPLLPHSFPLTPEQAERAYDEAARYFRGEFTKLKIRPILLEEEETQLRVNQKPIFCARSSRRWMIFQMQRVML